MTYKKITAGKYIASNGMNITKVKSTSWGAGKGARQSSNNTKSCTMWSVEELTEEGYQKNSWKFNTLTEAKAFIESL